MKYIYILGLITGMLVAYATTNITVSDAQEKGRMEKGNDKPVLINKVIRLAGWDIPTIKESELISSGQIIKDEQTIEAKLYKLQNSFDVKLDTYSLNSDNSLNTSFENVEVKNVVSYSLSGKIFAYRVLSVGVVNNPNGSKVFKGLLYQTYYSDEDGDGNFETRYIGNDVPIQVPSWISSINK